MTDIAPQLGEGIPNGGRPARTRLGLLLALLLSSSTGLGAQTAGSDADVASVLDVQWVTSAKHLTGSGPDAPTPVVVDAWTLQVLQVGGGPSATGERSTGGSQEVSTTMCYDNAALSGFSGIVPIGVEAVDWGIKGCQGTSIVTRLAIGYATTALDPSLGGPGATFEFALYDGTLGFGFLGTQVARFALTGMPGTTTPGQVHTFALFLDFGNAPLQLPDGNVGYGFHGKDGATGPLLTTAPNPQLGTQDLLDLYTPAPADPSNYLVTGPPFPGQNTGSIALQIEQLEPDPLANTVLENGSGVNPVVFTEVQAAVLGTTWVGTVALSGFPGASITALGVSEGAFTPVITPFGELLVDPTSPTFFLDIGFGLHAQAVTPRLDLLNRTFRAQAVIVLSPSGLQFTNGLLVSTGF